MGLGCDACKFDDIKFFEREFLYPKDNNNSNNRSNDIFFINENIQGDNNNNNYKENNSNNLKSQIISLTKQIKIDDIKKNINDINNIISPFLSSEKKDEKETSKNNNNIKNNIIIGNQNNKNINQNSKKNQNQQEKNKNNYNEQFAYINSEDKKSAQNYNNIQINNQQSYNNINNQEKINIEEDSIKNPKKGRVNILAKLDKEKLKKIISACPKRTSISLNNFREHLKKVTNNLTEEEKAYALFYWMSQNIKYDAESYFAGVYHVEPEETYNNGCSVCSGYSRLFKYIGDYLGLDIICTGGYVKGYGYNPREKISGTNHEWNIIKFNNVYYQIDSTWGAGSLNGRDFKKELCEFYFCPEPEQIISTHLPEEDKWQLIYPPLSEEEFGKRVKLNSKFYNFFTTDAIYHTFKVKSKHTIRFNKINEKENIGAILRVFDKQGKETDNAKGLILYDKNYIDFFYIFKKKGTYQTKLYADYASKREKTEMVTYYLECEEDYNETPTTPFNLPETYGNDITIISPIYNILKKGKKVTLKFKSDVTDEIIVTNGQWLTIKKNEDGIFETTITINTNEVFIGIQSKENKFKTSLVYKVN